jgi:hypothetical protein
VSTAEVIYDGPWHYRGYHGVRSVCYLRLYQPIALQSAIAVFTELADNPGTSVTNRIEVLVTLVWEFLQKPADAPIVIEHYPNRGVYNPARDKWAERQPASKLWQFPESFDIVEFARKPDGSFEKPRWRRIPRAEAEKLIGQRLP